MLTQLFICTIADRFSSPLLAADKSSQPNRSMPGKPARVTVLSFAMSAALSLAAVSISGCASIANSGPRQIPLNSTPAGATVTIFDNKGEKLSEHITPFVAKLDPKGGFFRGARYRFRVSASGYESHEVNIVPRISGWYIGNVLFGGPIGLLVIDPITGAMYNLTPEEVEQSLDDNEAGVVEDGEGFRVVLSSDLSVGERDAMVPIETDTFE